MQQLALAKAEADAERPPSKLASHLIQKWAWGELSAPGVQSIAQAAFEDGLHHPEVEQLAKIGARGIHQGNTHRDLLLLAGKGSQLPEATSKIPVRVIMQKNVSADVPLDFLLPHKLFATMYHSLPKAFETSILGGDQGNIATFWNAMMGHPIVKSRPALRGRADLHKVVPIGIHGDGVSYQNVNRAGGKSLEVLSWASLLTRGPTRVSSFLMFLIVKSVVKDWGPCQTWAKVWQVLCWSLQALSTGLWPMTDWEHKEFEVTSEDYAKRGTPLANGYCAFVFVLRADLDFLSNHFQLNSPSSNTPCALCRADRSMDSVPWTDCRTMAAWRMTCWSAAEWAREHPNAHPFFRMEGSGLDLLFPDMMHTKHLGTDQLLLGSSLTWLVKHYLPGTVTENLEMVWEFIQAWFKDCMVLEKEHHRKKRSSSRSPLKASPHPSSLI